MQYILLNYVVESGWGELSDAQKEAGLGAYRAYVDAMAKAGVLKASTGLQQTRTATSLRIRDGKTQVLDGPFAETREQLGGFHIVDVPDLDAALRWAARCPTALFGTVEVRPLNDML